MTNTRRKIVPVEATEEMLCDGWYHATRNGNTERVNSDDFIPAYKAMIAASPDASEDKELVKQIAQLVSPMAFERTPTGRRSLARASASIAALAVARAILKTIEGTPND